MWAMHQHNIDWVGCSMWARKKEGDRHQEKLRLSYNNKSISIHTHTHASRTQNIITYL